MNQAAMSPVIIEMFSKVIAAIETNNKMQKQIVELLENQKQTVECQSTVLEYISEKASCAEMRQCQTAGEATDASRMTSNFLRAKSALWSNHTKQVILETLATKGTLESIRYQGIFSEKDKRRSQLLAAIFYTSFC